MKKLLIFGAAFVAFFSAQNPAFAADGCKALLCFANPNGPMAVSECVPTVKEVIRDMAKGKPFPTCFSEDGSAVNGTIGLGYIPLLNPIGSKNCHPALESRKSRFSGANVPDGLAYCNAGYAISVTVEGIEPFTYYTVPNFWNSDVDEVTEVQYWRDKNGVAKTGQRF